MSRNAVNKAERGDTLPRELTLRAWAMRTGVDLNWLKTGETPPRDGDGASECRLGESNSRPIHYKRTGFYPVSPIRSAA